MNKKSKGRIARRLAGGLFVAAIGWFSTAGCAANIQAAADLSETHPYAQQNVVYTVRVYTDRTLSTADVTLPQVSGGIFRKLDEEWAARPVSGQQGTYVNERRYLFTALRAGRIEIPPATVDVTMSGGGQQPSAQPWGGQYNQPWGQQPGMSQPYGLPQPGQLYGQPWGAQPAQQVPFGQQPAQQSPYGQPAPQSYGQQPYGYPGYTQQQRGGPQGASERLQLRTSPLSVEVTALVGDAAGLLPLHSLRIEGNLQAVGEPRVGEPVTVLVTTTGVGITGDRLPGVADRLQTSLKTDDFKVYAERPHTEWSFDERLQAVVGRRVETVTLVPTRAGALELPIVEIPYWNVISGRQETARMATRPLRVGQTGSGPPAAAPRPQSRANGEARVPLRTGSEDIKGFWLPVGGALLIAFLVGWRIGTVQRRHRRKMDLARTGDTEPSPSPSPFAALAPAVERGRQATARLMPTAMSERFSAGLSAVSRGITRIIPRRVKVWTCMRCVQRTEEAHGICKALRRFSVDCLGLPENSSLRTIGHAVARERPTAETSAYVNLFGRLDDAAYGAGSDGFDVAAWKKDFSKLFGRLLHRPRRWLRRPAGGGLPELNPR